MRYFEKCSRDGILHFDSYFIENENSLCPSQQQINFGIGNGLPLNMAQTITCTNGDTYVSSDLNVLICHGELKKRICVYIVFWKDPLNSTDIANLRETLCINENILCIINIILTLLIDELNFSSLK